MPEKKRDRHSENSNPRSTQRISSQPLNTFDDLLNIQMSETIASVVRAETFPPPSGDEIPRDDDEERPSEVYRLHKKGERYTQDPYTVAENYIDRVQFRH